MTPRLHALAVLGWLGCFALSSQVASCKRPASDEATAVRGEASGSTQRPAGAAAASATSSSAGGEHAAIVELPGVDTSSLVATEKQLFSDVVATYLSPCGEPVTLEKCVRDHASCKACLPAAQYVARMSKLGVDSISIRAWLMGRFSASPAVIARDASPAIGASTPKVTIVEFMDFECPHCAAMAPVLRTVIAEPEFASTTSLVVKHFPLPKHVHGRDAAIAAIAADAQGKFFPMYDALFAHQDALEAGDREAYARTIGCDLASWKRALTAPATLDRLTRDLALGASLGFVGVPTVYIDGREFRPLGQEDTTEDQLRTWLRLDLQLMGK